MFVSCSPSPFHLPSFLELLLSIPLLYLLSSVGWLTNGFTHIPLFTTHFYLQSPSSIPSLPLILFLTPATSFSYLLHLCSLHLLSLPLSDFLTVVGMVMSFTLLHLFSSNLKTTSPFTGWPYVYLRGHDHCYHCHILVLLKPFCTQWKLFFKKRRKKKNLLVILNKKTRRDME